MSVTQSVPQAFASFPLLDDVIVIADAAMRARTPAKIVPLLVDGLRGLLGGIGALPPELLRADPAGYVRHELFRSPRFGYQVLAITWGPGQRSPIHDHANVWGVEAVLRGQLDVVDYRVARRHRALSELRPFDHHALADGSVIGLLPPHDLHACRNPGTRDTAVSLHVYGSELDVVKRYTHVEGDLYRPQRVHLTGV